MKTLLIIGGVCLVVPVGILIINVVGAFCYAFDYLKFNVLKY